MDKITTKMETLTKVYKILKKNHIEEVSFEFLVGSCFPNVMDNIKKEMRRQYTMGYVEGQKDRNEK